MRSQYEFGMDIKKLGVLGVVDMCQLLLNGSEPFKKGHSFQISLQTFLKKNSDTTYYQEVLALLLNCVLAQQQGFSWINVQCGVNDK